MNFSFKNIMTFFVVIPLFLILGGGAGLWIKISNMENVEVTKDINEHFKSIDFDNEDETQGEFYETQGNSEPIQAVNNNEKQTVKRYKKRDKKRVVKKKRTFKKWKGIKRLAFNTFIVNKNLFDDAKDNHKKYVGAAKAFLAEKNGGPVGFVVRHVSSGSYLRGIGLINGDILTAVNGFALNSAKSTTVAIASSQKASQFRLDIIRNSKTLSLYYRLK